MCSVHHHSVLLLLLTLHEMQLKWVYPNHSNKHLLIEGYVPGMSCTLETIFDGGKY